MKRTYTRNFGQTQMTNYAPSYKRRPFKKVRVQGNQLVPYGRSSLYVQRPYQRAIGARGISKGVDVDIQALNVVTGSNNNFVIPLNLIQAGTGSWNRVGRLITMKSIRLRMSIAYRIPPEVTDVEGNSLRFMIVYDKQPNGTLPSRADILGVKNQNGLETLYWNGYLTYDNMERFTILKDDTIDFNLKYRGLSSTGNGAHRTSINKTLDCYLPLNHVTNFKAESSPSTIGDVSTGGLYLIYYTSMTATSATLPQIHVEPPSYARLRYIDRQ